MMPLLSNNLQALGLLAGTGPRLYLFISKYDNVFELALESSGDGVSDGSESEKLTFFFCLPLRTDAEELELRAGDESRFWLGMVDTL